jgi:hypothetical protein
MTHIEITMEKVMKALTHQKLKDFIHEYDEEKSLDINPSLQVITN